jgi:tRNA(fMet)-specific endonuclease VapC
VNGVLLDTNAYVAFTRGEHDAVDAVSRLPQLLVSAIVLGELKAGFAKGRDTAENLRRLEKFLSLPGIEVLDIDERTAEFYGKLHSALRSAGRLIPTNDIWIAASALQHDLVLFSYDRHFELVEGLRVGTKLIDFQS